MAAPSGQPDISSILAALARGGSASTPAQATPVQVQQPGLPQGFPANFAQHMAQASTPQQGGYPLPQPSSSGAVDLSAIRPVNSGSVSIADAIAKAKSIAADRGINYDTRAAPQGPPREDPRLAGRPYGNNNNSGAPAARQRSRSRSPARRPDNFRDNYNPYRDERRDADRRDRSFGGRDRSQSPPRGARTFSPNRGARSPPNRGAGGSNGADSETISVKSALVGLVIGRQGENLRRVESETGARVQFIPAREPNAIYRQCTISGSLRSREHAKAEINRVMEDNGDGPGSAPPPDFRGSGGPGGPRPPRGVSKSQDQPALREGENSIQIMVPDKTVGLIIGRGGETIRDLQERSGCHVNIVAENKSINGLRPVNLIGTPQAAAVAKEMILEIVESDTRAPPGGGPPPNERNRGGFDSHRGGLQDRGNDAGKITEEIYVPSEAVGMIIGKGGETIKEMQSVTGCKINVSQPQQPDVQRQIGLVGSRAAIEEAKRAIWEKVDTVQQRDQAGGRGERRGGNRNDGGGYGNQYSQPQQQQQQPYGQSPMGGASHTMAQMPMAGMPAMPGMAQAAAAAPAGGDPNADQYAAYGGYNNYVAMWYAALAAQGQGGQGQPPMAQ